MYTNILEPNQANIRDAAERLRGGGVVAFATETVYGLGCHALDAAAIDLVYQLKGRPRDNPLIAHVADVEAARALAEPWDVMADTLAKAFWPGALTIVAQRSVRVPPQASAGRDTLAIRCPAHPVAQRLLAAFGGPISAPSANRSGHVSATTAQHVADDFAGVNIPGIDELLILDGGPTATGIESTVVDVTTSPPRVLRPGQITAEQIGKACEAAVAAEPVTNQDASPGTASRHYAPARPAVLISAAIIDAGSPLPERVRGSKRIVVLSHTRPHGSWGAGWIAMPPDPDAYAARLYSALREAEAGPFDAIAIEQPPVNDPAWAAVADRLRRATA